MAISKDSIDFAGNQGTTSASTNNATPTAVGLIVVGAVYNGGTLTSITDTYGNTYSIVSLGSVDGAGLDNMVVAYAQNTSLTSGHVTINVSAGTCVIGGSNFIGLATSSPLDRTQSANSGGANGTALDSGLTTQATQFPNELLVGIGTQATGSNVTWTQGTNYTLNGNASVIVGVSGRILCFEYRIVSSAAQYGATATSSVSAKWGMGIATFSDTPVPGGAPGPSASLLFHRKNVLYFI